MVPAFDTINFTNGYHPLWCLICALAYKMCPSPSTGMRVALTLAVAIWGAGAWFAWSAFRRSGIVWAQVTTFVFCLTSVWRLTYLTGMETGLLETSTLLLFAVVRQKNLLDRKAGTKQSILLGALLTLVIFSRLDSCFLLLGLVPALAALHWKSGFRSFAKRCIVTLAYPLCRWQYTWR